MASEPDATGEIDGTAAILEMLRLLTFPNQSLKGEVNLLIMPNRVVAGTPFDLLKMVVGNGVAS